MDFDLKIDKKSSESLYCQLSRQLKQKIVDSKLVPGTPLPSIKVLADSCHVSTRTMDQAIVELIEEGICYRRPKKGTFIGRNTRIASHKPVILLYVPTFGLKYFTSDYADRTIFMGMRREATAQGISLIMINEDLGDYLEKADLHIGGVILLESSPVKELNKILWHYKQLKFIYVNYFFNGFERTADNVFGVFNDDCGGAFQAAEYFFSNGYKNPLILTGDAESLNYPQRIRGYAMAAKHYGISIPEERICKVNSCDDYRDYGLGARNAVRRILDSGLPVDLILSNCDLFCKPVYSLLREQGRPDIQLVNYDCYDLPDLEAGCAGVKVNFEEMGRLAVQMIASKYPCNKQIKIFPTFLLPKR